jgi:hypothetical protein
MTIGHAVFQKEFLMNFNFGEVLTRAWQITWKYKILWIFGILASCSRGGGGGGSNGGGGGNGNGNNNWNGQPPAFIYEWERSFERAGQWMLENWWIFILIGLAFLLLIALTVFLGNIGRIGLIRGTLQAEGGAEKLSFGELFSGSLPYFWRVFGLGFLIGLAFLVILLPMIGFGIITAGIGFLCLLPLICILSLVGIVVGLILELANVAIVKEDLSMWEGLKRGWDLARANIGPFVGMALILFAISVVVGIVIAIPIIIILIPTMIGFFAGGANSMTPLLIGGLCCAAFLPVGILLNGIMNTYIGSAWTLTYLRLTPSTAPAGNDAPVLADETQA